MHWILLFLFIAQFLPGSFAMALSTSEIENGMGVAITRVPEFAFLRAEAEKLGVKAYLFGGTAAAYAHYVKQDLRKKAGEERFSATDFDYDYTRIFRSTQDLDVVIDGNAEQAAELEWILKKQYPHFVGDKAAKWEIRPLRESRGDKEAILENPSFQNQHTDSHSTGLVEVTTSQAGEPLVRDARDWTGRPPQFLRDVAEQKIHYYFSDLHHTTKRFQAGQNPPIVSVIRFLTKAFQYDLAIRPEDMARVRGIVNDFAPGTLDPKGYVAGWIERNGKKLFQHAVDMEQAWNVIEDLGLRKKLMALGSDANTTDSLAWWMNKEPLRSKPVGSGDGKTARELFAELGEKDLLVSHETNGYLAFESITRDRGGGVNAFISRKGAAGEASIYDEGFYTVVGRKGARHTGMTIRMALDPDARLGSDFEYVPDHNYIIVKNKKALKVNPEAIQLSLLEYFRQIATTGESWNADDRALIEAFRRRAGREGIVSAEDLEVVRGLVETELKDADREVRTPKIELLKEWLRLQESLKHPELAKTVLRKFWKSGLSEHSQPFSNEVYYLAKLLKDSPWQKQENLWKMIWTLPTSEIQEKKFYRKVVAFLAPMPDRPGSLDFLKMLIQDKDDNSWIIGQFFSRSEWWLHPERKQLLEAVYQSEQPLSNVLSSVMHSRQNPPSNAERDEVLRRVLETGRGDSELERWILDDRYKGTAMPDLIVEKLLERGSADKYIAEYVLKKPERGQSEKFARWFAIVLQRGKADYLLPYRISSLPEPQLTNAVETILARGGNDFSLSRALGIYPLSKHPRLFYWLKILAERSQPGANTVLCDVFSNGLNKPEEKFSWAEQPQAVAIFEYLLSRGSNDDEIARLLGKSDWNSRPEAARWLRTIVERGNAEAMRALEVNSILRDPNWHHHHRQLTEDFHRVDYDADSLRSLWIQRKNPPRAATVTVYVNGVPVPCQVVYEQVR